MKQIPVCKASITTGKRLYSCIAILVLFLVCGYGSLVAADDNVRIQADPVDGAPPLTVIFSADIQSPLGEPSHYVWSLGDGEEQMDPSFSYTYNEEGTYQVNLIVQFEDESLAYADAVQITVGDPAEIPATTTTPAPTIAALQAPVFVTNNNPAYPLTVSISQVEGTEPLAVEFIIEEAGGSQVLPVTYSWDFDDNERGEGDKQHHIYANSGEYFPVVTVKFSNDHIETFPLPQVIVLSEITAVATQAQAAPEEEGPEEKIPTPRSTPMPIVTRIAPALPKLDGYSVAIIPDKVSGPTPLQVRFTSETKGSLPLAWKWDFGNGHKNTVEKPTQNYGIPGTYVVQLSVQFRGPVWIDAEPVVITVG